MIMLLSAIKKLIPKPLFHALQPVWHWGLAFLGALVYRFPSRKLIVIGVTGTKGKTTTCVLLTHILEAAGYKVGMTTTALFRIAGREWLNNTKQTMQGRLTMQKLLRRMVREECTIAVIETSSEAIKQYRHTWINYQAAILTNLSPEHIESHGSFEKYREAKGKLFRETAKQRNSLAVVNLDEKDTDYFLQFPAKKKIGFTLNGVQNTEAQQTLFATNRNVTERKSSFMVGESTFHLHLGGIFNVANALAALAVARNLNIDDKTIQKGFDRVQSVPGRMEYIDEGQDFDVVVDYAHEPRSLEAIYTVLKSKTRGKLIAILGAAGGGRDKQKRARLGELAAQYADVVIVTDEDPYDEDPRAIMDMVAEGARFFGKTSGVEEERRDGSTPDVEEKKHHCTVEIIEDRKNAIKNAIKQAQSGDVVIITGKGCEPWIIRANGKKVPWDDREIVRKALQEKNS